MIQIENNVVKNPNQLEANQLAMYKHGRGFELGATRKQIQVVVRDSNTCTGPLDCESVNLTTRQWTSGSCKIHVLTIPNLFVNMNLIYIQTNLHRLNTF